MLSARIRYTSVLSDIVFDHFIEADYLYTRVTPRPPSVWRSNLGLTYYCIANQAATPRNLTRVKATAIGTLLGIREDRDKIPCRRHANVDLRRRSNI